MAKGKARTKLLDHSASLVEGSKEGPSWDFLYQASTVKHPDYNLGDRVQLPDGRVFRYGKCGASLADMKHGVKNWNLLVTELDAIAVAASIGDSEIEITFADTDGVANDGVIAEDSLRGGYISFYRGQDRQQRGILGNTARANGDTGNTKLWLDAALVTAINEDDNVEVMANPYSDLRIVNNMAVSVMGMPAVKATVGQYFWIQTWGICRITPTGAEMGSSAYPERQLCFDSGGSIMTHEADHDAGNTSYQHAGFVVERIASPTAGSAAPFVNIQINP